MVQSWSFAAGVCVTRRVSAGIWYIHKHPSRPKVKWWRFERVNTCSLTSKCRLEIRCHTAFSGNHLVNFGYRCSVLRVDVFVWTKTTRPRSTGLAGGWPSWWRNGHSNPARKHLSRRAGCQSCNSRDAAGFSFAWNNWAVAYFDSKIMHGKKP